MAGRYKLNGLLGPRLLRLRGSEAAALIEFAVSLPLLVVLVIGIFDFGGAFNLKQELNNAAREGAVFGASQPTNDLLITTGTPPSVDAVRYLVAAYLQGAGINPCGLNTMSPPTSQSGPMTWLYATTGTCVAGLTLTIQRPCIGPGCPSSLGAYVPYTSVTISYPYQWHFNNVIQLLVPGANFTLTNIATNATAANMN